MQANIAERKTMDPKNVPTSESKDIGMQTQIARPRKKRVVHRKATAKWTRKSRID
jgi:hypothetical protein